MPTVELIVKGVDQASDILGGIGKVAGGLALGGVAAFGAAVVSGIAGAREAAQVQAQTAQVIKSTGEAAGVSAQHVTDYAGSLSDAAGQSLFSGEQVQQSTNLLLTFTNIKGHALDAATAISVDMAQAMDGKPKDAAIQLGKALNDPIAGISALTKVGVSFDDQQKAQIKTMVEAGNVAGAQGIILGELNKEFGGSAKAAADADGGWTQFQARIGDAEKAVGTALLPVLGTLGGILNDTLAPAIESAASGLSAFVTANGPQIQAFAQSIISGLGQVGPLLSSMWDQLQGPIQTVISLFQQAMPAIQPLIDLIGANLQPILLAVATVLGGAVVAAIGSAIASFAAVAAPIAAAIAIGAALYAAWTSDFGGVRTTVTEVMTNIQQTFTVVVAALTSFWEAHGTQIMAIATQVFGYLQTYIGGALQVIAGIFNTVMALIRGDWSGAWDGIKQIAQGFMTELRGIFGGLEALLSVAFNAAIDAAKGAWNNFTSSASTLGRAVIDGIISGVRNGVGALENAVSNAAQSALDAAKSLLGIKSPSRVFADEVGSPIAAGIAAGLIGSFDGVIDTIQAFTGKASDAAKKAVANLAREIHDLARSELSGSASLDRSRAGALDDLAGLLPDTKAIDAVASRITDVNAKIAAAQQGLASSDADERAKASQDLGDLFQQRQQLMDQQTKLQAAQAQSRQIEADAQTQLQQADAEAATLRASDPKLASDYFDLRRKQIVELARLQQDAAGATSDDERNRIQEQISLVTAAQQAELQGFQSDATDRQQQISALTTLPHTTNQALNDLLQQLRDMLLPVADAMHGLTDSIPSLPTTPTVPGVSGATTRSANGLLAAAGPQVTFAANSIVVNGGAGVAAQVEQAVTAALAKAGFQADARRRTR